MENDVKQKLFEFFIVRVRCDLAPALPWLIHEWVTANKALIYTIPPYSAILLNWMSEAIAGTTQLYELDNGIQERASFPNVENTLLIVSLVSKTQSIKEKT